MSDSEEEEEEEPSSCSSNCNRPLVPILHVVSRELPLSMFVVDGSLSLQEATSGGKKLLKAYADIDDLLLLT